MAILTGGQVISEEVGLKLENTTLDLLGRARKVVVTKDDTTIVEGAGSDDDVKGRISQIKREIENTDSDWDREKLQERLAKLSGGVAVVKVGAATEVELKEKKHRIEDALSATRAAIEEGVVAGGGAALLRARAAVAKLVETLEGDEATGARAVWHALEAPARLIADNAGARGCGHRRSRSSARPARSASTPRPASSRTCVKAGVIDPAKVTRAALQNAASIAGPAAHHRGAHRRQAREGVRDGRRWRNGWHGRHGWHGRNGDDVAPPFSQRTIDCAPGHVPGALSSPDR